MAEQDINIIQPHEDVLRDVSTDEVLTMVLGTDEDDDITIGRMSQGLDESEFDALPAFEWDIAVEQAGESDLYTGTNIAPPITSAPPAAVLGDDEEEDIAPFSDDGVEEVFPTFKRALSHFRSQATPARVVRIDNEQTYNKLVGESAIRELARRLDELRAYTEDHVRDLDVHNSFTPAAHPMSAWSEVIGCAQMIDTLRGATSPDDVTDAMAVPLDLPDFAQGKVKCWRDGDTIIVSLCFTCADGSPRYASMAGRPKVDADDVMGWASRAGADPVTILGVAMDLADSACGKRLVRDAASAALSSQRRVDVVGMDGDVDPVLLVNGGEEDAAPLAALMYVQQAAEAGDSQAAHEMSLISAAAESPTGQQVAKPMIAEARRRLALGRGQKMEGCC